MSYELTQYVRQQEHAMKVAGLPTTIERTRAAIGRPPQPESVEERMDRIEAHIQRLEDTLVVIASLRAEPSKGEVDG